MGQRLPHEVTAVLISVYPVSEIAPSGIPSLIIIYFLGTKYHGSNLKGPRITEGIHSFFQMWGGVDHPRLSGQVLGI